MNQDNDNLVTPEGRPVAREITYPHKCAGCGLLYDAQTKGPYKGYCLNCKNPAIEIKPPKPQLRPPRYCKTCGMKFAPPMKKGRPTFYCSEECKPAFINALRAEKRRHAAREQKAKAQNRRKQARYQANVTSAPSTEARLERQEKLLALVSAPGSVIKNACATVGITEQTLYQYRHRDADFRLRFNRAREKARGEFEAEVIPFDADFRKRFFHHDTPPHMQKLIDVITEQVEIAEREQRRDRRILILLPPEHGKTTVVLEYLAYRLAMDASFRASMICSTQNQARKRIGALSRMLTDRNEYADLVDTYGPFRSESRSDVKPWTADYLTHLRAPAGQVDYSLQCLGWTGTTYGDRMDIVVNDDIATMKNQTPALIEAQWEKTWGENRSRIRKGGLFVVIGTHMREADIYTVMKDKGFFSDVVVLPAITREPGTLNEDDPGEALWEQGTSLAELLKLRKDDPRLFELMYQQNPLPSVGAIFPYDSIESCFDDTRTIGDIPSGSVIVAGIDPSVSNYTAGVVFALKPVRNGEWMRYLVDVWNKKNLTGDGGDNHIGVVDFIVELCRIYNVSTLCVEDGAWMSLINNSFTLRSKLYELGVSHFPVKATEQTVGAEAIRALSGLFNHRLISLPGTPNSKQHLSQFTHQLLTWTGEKSHWRKSFDIVKALRQCEHAVQFTLNSTKGRVKQVAGDDVAPWMLDVVNA